MKPGELSVRFHPSSFILHPLAPGRGHVSLRTKLFLSYAGVILLALVLAGIVTVAIRWRERQQAAIDRLAVAAPQISLDVFRLQRAPATADQVSDFVHDEAERRDV